MSDVVDALMKSLPVGNKFFTANVKEGQYTVFVFCSIPPDMERVKREVTGANNTATVTCTCHQGQWDVTMTWVEPYTSKDKAIARALQKKENACGRGGAGANGRGGVGGGASAMWTTEERLKYAQEVADHNLALQLANDEGCGGASCGGCDGRVDVSAGCGDHVVYPTTVDELQKMKL
jgi:hypothetical protein